MNEPNPIKHLACNKTATNLYLDVVYSPTDALIATGDNKEVMLFHYDNDDFGFLTQVSQPKSEEVHFAAVFPPKKDDQNKELLTANGLYVNMIIYDDKAPSMKILQSEKT